MTKISGLPPGFDDAARARGQADVANQHDSWLRQMELAQMNDMNKAGSQRCLAAPAHAGMPRAPLAPAAHSTRAEPAAPQRRAEPAPPRRNAEHQQQGAKEQGPYAPATTHSTALQPLQAASVDLAPAQPVPGTVPAMVAAMPARVAAAIAAGATAIESGTPFAAKHQPVLAGILSADMPVPASGPSEAAEGETAPQAASDHEPMPEAPREFQKRMMHLTGSGQDVKLWIRDSALGQAQSLELVYRMAGDMAAMGLRLKGATINGKPALPADHLEPRADSVDAAPHTLISKLENNHGA